ncbi:MAG: hypothetical protein R3E93_12080 [Thiothrix sp.]
MSHEPCPQGRKQVWITGWCSLSPLTADMNLFERDEQQTIDSTQLLHAVTDQLWGDVRKHDILITSCTTSFTPASVRVSTRAVAAGEDERSGRWVVGIPQSGMVRMTVPQTTGAGSSMTARIDPASLNELMGQWLCGRAYQGSHTCAAIWRKISAIRLPQRRSGKTMCNWCKFHGSTQDDRDVRLHGRKSETEPAYSFMIRLRVPGG